MHHRVKLRREDGVQVFDMPKDLELPGDEAVLRLDNGRLVLEALGVGSRPTESLLDYLRTLEPLAEEDWMPAITDDDLLPLDDDDFPFKDLKL